MGGVPVCTSFSVSVSMCVSPYDSECKLFCISVHTCTPKCLGEGGTPHLGQLYGALVHLAIVQTTLLLCMCSGIASGSGGSGFEMEQEDAITLVQLVVSKCLDKEILCNELYLQLIKQTTDQPGDSVSKYPV